MKRQRKGFTLVELAIVIAILGILAVIAIPKYQGMEDQARSSAAKAQLGTVRSAIGIYYAKNKGQFPATLDGTLFADGTMPVVDVGQGGVNTVVPDATASTVITGDDFTNGGGWVYNATTGEVRINSTAKDPASSSDADSQVAWSTY